MAHVAKFTGGAMGHMLSHYDRTKEIENIDPKRSHLNYNLAADEQPERQLDFIHRRLSEVRVQNRKDVNKLCDWIVTAPKDLPESEHPEFFRQTYEFLREKYGSKNIVSAYVHMDEVTPHIHFAFVPVVADKSRNGEKLSAKEAVTRSDLRQFHEQLQSRIEEKLGHPVSIQNEATRKGNKSIDELRRISAIERLAEVGAEAVEIVSKARKEAKGIEDSLQPLKTEFEALRALVAQIDCCKYPPEAKIKKKGIFKKHEFVTVPKELWEKKYISANARLDVVLALDKLDTGLKNFKRTSSGKEIFELKAKVAELSEDNQKLSAENYKLKLTVQKEKKEARQIIDKVNGILERIPTQMAQAFIDEWNRQDRLRTSRNKEIER